MDSSSQVAGSQVAGSMDRELAGHQVGGFQNSPGVWLDLDSCRD